MLVMTFVGSWVFFFFFQSKWSWCGKVLLGVVISDWFFSPSHPCQIWYSVSYNIIEWFFVKLFMNMGNPSLHSLGYTYISGSLTALTRHFFRQSSWELWNCFCKLAFFPQIWSLPVFCGSLSLTEERKMCPTLPTTITLLTEWMMS